MIELPQPLAIYFSMDGVPDDVQLARCFTEDAFVLDEGQPWEGLASIAAWMTETKERFKHSTRPIGSAMREGKIVITGSVSGSFPHSPVKLDFIFDLEGDRIRSMECPLPADRLLAPLLGRRPEPPDWFDWALTQQPERLIVPIAGVGIETLSWGVRGAPGLLLLHEQAAHAHWWSFIAPFLADRFRVTALSWSGMGGSGWRDAYDTATRVAEIVAVAEACGQFDGPQRPVAIGHGRGGIPLIAAARLGGVILLDCDAVTPVTAVAAPPAGKPRPIRPYASLEKALIPFRLEPPQLCANLALVDHVARHAMHEILSGEGRTSGWTWRLDPDLRAKTASDPVPDLAAPGSPVAVIAGGRSNVVTPEVLAETMSRLPANTPLIRIADAGHHVMLDQPIALIAALDGLLAAWPSPPDAVRHDGETE